MILFSFTLNVNKGLNAYLLIQTKKNAWLAERQFIPMSKAIYLNRCHLAYQKSTLRR